MKISKDMRYPHPILSEDTGDFPNSAFNIDMEIVEDIENNELTIDYKYEILHEDIAELVFNNKAIVSLLVVCNDTYYDRLFNLELNSGKIDFGKGILFNKVTLQPLIWLEESLTGWCPRHIHSEFKLPINIEKYNIIGIGNEYIIHVGNAKTSNIESIFSLQKSSEILDDIIDISLDNDKLIINTSESLFEHINRLRCHNEGLSVIRNSVYLPAIMQILDTLKTESHTFEDKRWYLPFTIRCENLNIDITNGDILANAQKLLANPASLLTKIFMD